MNTRMGEIQENTPGGQKINSYIKGLEKRLAELIEQDSRRGQISFGYVVLSSVAQGNYDRATKELDSVGIGFEGYPQFEIRSRRFVEHAKGLVHAIKTKYEVGKSPHVNKSKQKELSDRIAEHFVDLKKTLIVIEKVQKSVRSADLGSTVFFFRVCFFSLAAVFIFYTIFQNSSLSDSMSLQDIISFFNFQLPD